MPEHVIELGLLVVFALIGLIFLTALRRGRLHNDRVAQQNDALIEQRNREAEALNRQLALQEAQVAALERIAAALEKRA
jgi:hypothetical protein